SELSWRHVEHPSEVVQVGQEVEVEVLDVDLERERISLSLKKTQEDPWRQFARLHQPGEIIEGQVTKLVPFGAFVRVADGVEGLVHISELADRHVDTAEQVVTVGENTKVKIIEVDSERRRISLSIKQAGVEGPPIPEEIELVAEEQEEAEEKEEAPGPDVLEAAMAPEAETAKPDETDPDHARPLGEETIEAIVADVPLLAEVGAGDMFDLIVVVTASQAAQIERMRTTRSMDVGAARARIAAQLPASDRAAIADVVVQNGGSLEDLGREIDALWS